MLDADDTLSGNPARTGTATDHGGDTTGRLARIGEQARWHLMEEIIPFWFPQAVDRGRGGYYTCYDNRGRFSSDRKYTWSQGRFVSVCAGLAEAGRAGLLQVDADQLLTDARQGAEFVRDHALRADDTTHYVLDGDGVPIDTGERSFYADCFAAIGFAGLARAARDGDWLELARRVTDTAWCTAGAREVPTAPYQLPADTEAFGVHMILLNLELDIARARTALGLPDDPEHLQRAVAGVMSMARPAGTFTEVRGEHLADDLLLTTHDTPGHALEGLWMLAGAGTALGAPELDELADRAVALCELGHDREHGGLFRYVHHGGGPPRGRLTGLPYENLVLRTWDTKLWWVHSEASWTLTLLAEHTGREDLARWRDAIWDYTRATFPARGEGEEWIQVRDRQGAPLDTVVALPLKDPYHVTRNLLQLVTLAAPRTAATA
ncbi:AGE family epimerase/isomerase [Propionibacteriaceae bacterium Y1923]